MNLNPLEAELDPFFEHLEGILRPIARTESHEAMDTSRMLAHCVGDVLISLSVIRRLPYADSESHDPIDARGVHGLQHVLCHEFHDRWNLMDREFFPSAHV